MERGKDITASPDYQEVLSCRSCGEGGLTPILDLGVHKIPGFSSEAKDIRIPLELCMCGECNLLQLKHNTKPDLLWNAEYGFKSGVNEAIRANHTETVTEVLQVVDLKAGDIVIDIGSNDATLLKNYPVDAHTVGFEPSKNVAHEGALALSDQRGLNFAIFNAFFDKYPFKHRFGNEKAKAVTAISMFYDLEDPNVFLQNVQEVLDDNGVLVIQQNYLAEMLRQCAFDNVVHEHLEYYSLTSLQPLLKRNGFEVFDVVTNNINGGSFKTFIRKHGSTLTRDGGLDRVEALMQQEKILGMDTAQPYLEFAARVERNGSHLREFVESVVESGQKVYVYGASTRGGTILQHYGLDNKLITAAVERNKDKWGKIMSTGNIPIISEEQARSEHPDYMLILPWFFADVFIDREQEYLKSGGKFIVPLPEFRVVGYEDISNYTNRAA